MAKSFTKDSFLLDCSKIVRNLIYMALDIRAHCHLSLLIDDISLFCHSNCEGKRLVQRLTTKFTVLSNVYKELMTLVYDRDADTVQE